jgi:hypothetical protein
MFVAAVARCDAALASIEQSPSSFARFIGATYRHVVSRTCALPRAAAEAFIVLS